MNLDRAHELTSGLGLQLEISGSRPLPELTAAVVALCEQVEDRDGKTVVVLALGAPADSRSWPGDVGVQQVSRWERAVRRLQRLANM